MASLARGKRIILVVGLALLAGLAWVVWPFIVGPGQMQTFCGSLEVGSSMKQIQTLAEQHGFRISVPSDGRVFVYDSSSFGRFTCDLQFKSDSLVSAIYSLND
jgi:hypothetical protein